MSKYTTTIHELKNCNFDFGLNEYPIFDESYRNVLNTKILNHYQFREIGFETPAMFKFYLNTIMCEIMPLYNKYYEAETHEINPLYNYNRTETNTRTMSGNSTANNSIENSTEDNSLNVASDTPQSMLATETIEANTYASSADKTKTTTAATSTGEATTQANSTDEYISNVVGTVGKSQAELLMEYRKTFINIDMKIINELNNLFMVIF